MKHELKFILLDDHSLFLEGMKSLLSKSFDVEFVTFNSIQSLEDSNLDYDNYDLFISDLELPKEDIFSLLNKLKENSDIPILVISMHQKISLIRKCIDMNIEGYILKNDDEYLISAVSNILEYKEYYSPNVKRILNDSSSQQKILSAREVQVIKCICKGYSNLKISNSLHIAVETVKTHKKNIKIKLGVSDNSEIIDYANKNFLF